MNAIVIEHVPVADLPKAWQEKFGQGLSGLASARVTVLIEQEPVASTTEEFVTSDPAFGIWRDHQDSADVEAYARHLRASRFNRDGSRKVQR